MMAIELQTVNALFAISTCGSLAVAFVLSGTARIDRLGGAL